MAVPRRTVYGYPSGYAPGGVTYRPPIYKAPTGYAPGGVQYTGRNPPQGGGAGAGVDLGGHPDDQPTREQLIQSDPTYMRTAAQAQYGVGAAGRNRANLIRQAIIKFGYAPPGWQSGYGDVDQATLEAAGQNPFSTQNEIERQRTNSQIDLRSLLGARGLYSSGALTGGLNQIGFAHDKAQDEATSTLLGSLHGYESDYADSEFDWANKLGEATDTAAANAAKLYPGIDWRTQAPPGATVSTSGYSPGVPNSGLADLYGAPRRLR